jgi:ABC-type amino acid transport substrate-binding protein
VPRNAGLLAKINTAIAGMRKDGAIDQILDKYR